MRTALAKQQLTEGAAREALIRQLGFVGRSGTSSSVTEFFTKNPIKPLEIASVERQAVENRLDMQIAKLNLENMAENLNLGRKSAFSQRLNLVLFWEKAEGEKERGYELEFRIPLFDAGELKMKKLNWFSNRLKHKPKSLRSLLHPTLAVP